MFPVPSGVFSLSFRHLFGFCMASVVISAPHLKGCDALSGHSMDPRFEALLKRLPQKRYRSCLEPYKDLIREMRKRGCCYREIAQVLHEEFGLKVGMSTINDFVLSRQKSKTRHGNRESFFATDRTRKDRGDSGRQQKATQEPPKTFQAPSEPTLSKPAPPVLFRYNHDEPLRILRKKGEHDE
jgi:hypothetical protein